MSNRETNNTRLRQFENLSKILQMSKAMQMRYTLIPNSALNNVTVAGIRDMNLGRLQNGKPVGAPVLRFNSPSLGTKSDFSRICIDPKGVSNKANPHIRVPPGMVNVAAKVQRSLEIGGKALLVVSLVTSAVRIGKTVYDEVTIDDEIEALGHIVDNLEEDLENDQLPNRAETQEALDFARELLDEAHDNKRYPGKKTLITTVTIGGEFAGAGALAFAGAELGALAGTVAGPIGSIAGAVTGGIGGAIAGSEFGRSAVENFKCDEEGISTQMNGSIIGWGGKVHGEVVGLKGNMSIGEKGLELGAGLALLDIGDKDSNFSILKADANVDITNKGVDIGIKSKVVRTELENTNVKVGCGLNLDTGFKIASDGVKLEVLGFGFSAGEKGFGIKLPVFDIFFKK